YLLPAFEKYGGVWYGYSGPEGDYYRGRLESEDKVIKLFSSAKVCPAVVEPHTTTLGFDIPERIFKLGAMGALVVSDPIAGLERYFPDGVQMAKDEAEYLELCGYWIDAPEDKRREEARRLQTQVFQFHTYFSRIQTLFAALGYDSEANDAQTTIDGLVQSVQ
ncbi:glycosyltransferase, partial [Planctomycetota bacterium]|nr:glycosyltransferase [Planctomycetota bacterium]